MIDSMPGSRQGQNARLMDEVPEACVPHHERERLASLLKAGKARSQPPEQRG